MAEAYEGLTQTEYSQLCEEFKQTKAAADHIFSVQELVEKYERMHDAMVKLYEKQQLQGEKGAEEKEQTIKELEMNLEIEKDKQNMIEMEYAQQVRRYKEQIEELVDANEELQEKVVQLVSLQRQHAT